MDDTTSQKAASDAAAYVRSLAEARGRNVMLAAEAVHESRAFTDTKRCDAMPPLIDLVAHDVDDLLRSSMAARSRASTAERRPFTRGMPRCGDRDDAAPAIPERHRAPADRLPAADARHARTDRRIVESRAPSLPGVAGGVCLLLAFFAFQILPVNTAGLLLIVFGLGAARSSS